jgi:integrase
MPTTKLTTKGSVNALPHPETGQVYYWDTVLRGFGVRVGTRDKTFIMQRDVNGKSRRITIGRYGDISLQLARQRAEGLGGQMTGGRIDPVEEQRKVTAAGMTLRDAWKLYEGHLDAKERSPTTKAGYLLLLETHCADWLDRPLAEITREAADTRHKRIGLQRGRYAANGTMRALRAIWRRARRQHPGLDEPPTVNVDFFKEKPRTAIIENLPAWWAGVQAIDNPIRRDLYIWLLFTGCRSGESTSLRWDQIDLKAGRVHFPVTKTEPFDLPLSTFLVDLLKRRRACERTIAVFGKGCPWVFPAHSKTGHIEEQRPTEKDLKLFPKPWIAHTLRHTWITISESKGLMPSTHSRLLTNHTVPKSGRDAHAGYIHPEFYDLKKSQEAMSKYLVAATQPKPKKSAKSKPKKSSCNVVPFAKEASR